MSYVCKKCNYTTSLKFNYTRHLASELHLVKENKLSCKYCQKEYKHKSSLSKHIKYSCKNKDEDRVELFRLVHLQLETGRIELKELRKQLEIQARQIEKLTDKLDIHESFNNNTINNYTLLAQEDYQRGGVV